MTFYLGECIHEVSSWHWNLLKNNWNNMHVNDIMHTEIYIKKKIISSFISVFIAVQGKGVFKYSQRSVFVVCTCTLWLKFWGHCIAVFYWAMYFLQGTTCICMQYKEACIELQICMTVAFLHSNYMYTSGGGGEINLIYYIKMRRYMYPEHGKHLCAYNLL